LPSRLGATAGFVSFGPGRLLLMIPGPGGEICGGGREESAPEGTQVAA